MRLFLIGLSLGALGPILFDRLRYRLKSEAKDSSRATAAAGAERSIEQPGEGEGARASDDLSQLTAAELYRRAQVAGISGRSAMSKAELIAALRAVDG
jgi:hypothetical protein